VYRECTREFLVKGLRTLRTKRKHDCEPYWEAVAHIVFPHQAGGSLIRKNGKIIGSELIGQNFTADKYFHGRPSATTDTDPKDPTETIPAPYNAVNSVGSNSGPTAKSLIDRIKGVTDKLKTENLGTPVAVYLVTTSASGLNPDITPAAAVFQVPRVAKARNLPEERVKQLVADATVGRWLGITLKLNMALDAAGGK
jgi:K+-transporting ATPase ATPase C chain